MNLKVDEEEYLSSFLSLNVMIFFLVELSVFKPKLGTLKSVCSDTQCSSSENVRVMGCEFLSWLDCRRSSVHEGVISNVDCVPIITLGSYCFKAWKRL